MKTAALIAFAASALSVVSAQGVQLSYGEPIGATTWSVGGTNTVKLNNDCKNQTTTTYDVVLQVQQNGLQTPYLNGKTALVLGQIDCAKKTNTLKVTLPDTVPSGNQYSILVTIAGVQSYSALFTVNNPKVPAVTTSAPPASSATSASASKPAATTGATTTSKPAATPSNSQNNAGSLKVGSTMALVVVAAAGLLL
ncbi:hypothetical protein B0O80DRAFT_463015 [Mortierella sp. GBAus27b]|nr:hypothetical protein BGX31_005769 [Mortierella sp. GBA43]KAI8348399.1 hypothetical protein B0O80DRAFT_463015 [Mortierella sp. GBAus27b]